MKLFCLKRQFSSVKPKLLWIALGNMGYPMSSHIHKKIGPTAVWDINIERVKQHNKEFGTTFIGGDNPFAYQTPNYDFIMSIVPTSFQVQDLADKLIATNSFKKGAVWIDFTSGKADMSYKIAQKLEKYGVGFVDAPVSGGTRGARGATVSIMYSGKKEYADAAFPYIQACGKNLLYIGEKAGSGHAVKSINNLLYGCILSLTIKGIQALEAGGVDPLKAVTAITNSSGGSASSAKVMEIVKNGKLQDYNFSTQLLVKDMKLGLDFITNAYGNDQSTDRIVKIMDEFIDLQKEVGDFYGWDKADIMDVFKYIKHLDNRK